MRIVSFSPVVPYPGIPHAGGTYVLAHAQALAEARHDVVLIAPDSAENRAAAGVAPVEVLLVGQAPTTGPDRRARFRPAQPPIAWERAIAESDAVRRLVETADVVEYQWTQTAALHRIIRGWSSAPAVCVAHDVLHQLARRQARRPGAHAAERTLRRLRALVVRNDERRILRRMQVTITFSEKDADLLRRELGVEAVEVVAPSLEPADPRWLSGRTAEPGNVVFVGAFDRSENADAAEWLVEAIWPAVVRAVAHARLQLVGANPTDRMRTLAARATSVSVSGYVEDLVPWYQTAAAVAVPLRQGAGVKFKTVTAMLWGVPIVSTNVGVEGIAGAGDGVFAAVRDDAAGFAAGLVSALTDPGADEIGARAREFASARYGRVGFEAAIAAVYARAVSGG